MKADANGGRVGSGGIVAMWRHEWRQLVYAPLTAVFLAGFSLALAACIFLIADFSSTDSASIDLLLTFLPWVALVFIPALAMRAWGDEPGNRAMELTLSLPLTGTAIVTGQWLAGGAVLLMAMFLTVPYVATIAYLGSPDWGVVIAGYCGAALVLLTFLAVALFVAALARDPVSAFVASLGLLFVLNLAGWDAFARFLHGQASATALDIIPLISPKYWFDRIGSGHIELAGLIYFAVATAVALIGAVWAIDTRRAGTTRFIRALRGAGWAVALLTAGTLLVAAARQMPAAALDWTAEKEFTLHRATLDIVRRQPADTFVDLYWSASDASIPMTIRTHARRVRDLLHMMSDHSSGRLRVVEHDPQPDTAEESAALAAGIRRIPLSAGGAFMLGAVFHHGTRQGRIEYFDIRRERLLEYDLAQALDSLGRARTTKVGVLTPLLAPRNVAQSREGLSVLEELKRGYDVAVVPHFADALPNDLDVLVVIDATVLKPEMLYAIDQHVMAGKGLIVMMDPHVRFNRASDLVTPRPSQEKINDISDLLLRYGVRYDGDEVVGDAKLALPVVDEAQEQLDYPYWLRIRADGLSSAHAVTANLNELVFAEPGALALTAGERALALVSTTDAAGGLARNEFAGKSPQALAANFTIKGGKRVLAAVLNGPFTSAFPRAIDGAPADQFKARSQGAGAVFVVADVDWLFDPFAYQEVRAGEHVFARPLNDNVAFLLNMVEYAAGAPTLIAIRSRGHLQRPFTRLAALAQAAQQRHAAEAGDLAQRIAKVEGAVAEVLKTAGVSRTDQLPSNLRSRIERLLTDLLPLRARLRDIRLSMREDVEALGRRLALINLASGPLLVLGFVVLARRLRRKRIA
jgi:ABC-2 type transport system permease protein